MTYAQQVIVARCIGVTIVAVGLITAGNLDLLGITPRMAAWLGILSAVLGSAASMLPSVRATGLDPEKLADRVWELPPDGRMVVATTLADRAAHDAAPDSTPLKRPRRRRVEAAP